LFETDPILFATGQLLTFKSIVTYSSFEHHGTQKIERRMVGMSKRNAKCTRRTTMMKVFYQWKYEHGGS